MIQSSKEYDKRIIIVHSPVTPHELLSEDLPSEEDFDDGTREPSEERFTPLKTK